MSEKKHFNSGKNNGRWKGGKCLYVSIHNSIRKKYGKANHCEECGLDEIPKGKKRWFEWSNIDGNYSKDRSDWQQLCMPCHKGIDKKKLKDPDYIPKLRSTTYANQNL